MTETRQNTVTPPFTPHDRDRLLALERQQIIRRTFTAFDASVSHGPLSNDEQELSYPMLLHGGHKGYALLPHLIVYLRQVGGWSKPYLRAAISENRFGIGGALLLIGRTAVPVEELDVLTTSELLIVPHLSAKGPNGVWRIERGDLHPLVLAVASVQLWTLSGTNGQPDFFFHVCADDPMDATSARGVDLFTTLTAANQWLKDSHEDDTPDLTAMALSARDLLSCLARSDVVSIDVHSYAVTRRGAIALEFTDVTTTQELLSALTS